MKPLKRRMVLRQAWSICDSTSGDWMNDSAIGRGHCALSMHKAVGAKNGAKTSVEYVRFNGRSCPRGKKPSSSFHL